MLLELDIEKKFPDFHGQFCVTLRHQRCGIFGPSGCGKSTLMHLLAGLLEPDCGRIVLDGRTLFDATAKINLPPEARRIAVVFQHARLFPHMNVEKT